jgi:sec-independent protein translocase protein TatC
MLGLVVGMVIGIPLGRYMVELIMRPLTDSLEVYYSQESVDKYNAFAEKRREAGLPVPYTEDEFKALIADRYLLDILYVDPRWAGSEWQRMHPTMAAPVAPSPPANVQSTPSSVSDALPKGLAGEEDSTASGASEATVQVPPLMPMLAFHQIADDDRIRPKALGVQEGFGIWFKASLVVGAILSSPWVFYHIWSFVAAGLYPHEKRYVHIFLPFSLGLFLAGAALAFVFVFQPVLNFLLSFNDWLGIDPDPRISEWLGFVLLLPLGFGVAFQLPLVMLFLERIGIFNVTAYLEKWRVAVLVIFILSAILTPADPYSIWLMAVPLTLLYFLGVMLCYFWPRSSGKSWE